MKTIETLAAELADALRAKAAGETQEGSAA